MVQFGERDSYQGMPTGVPQTRADSPLLAAARWQRKPAAEAVSCLARVRGIAEAKP
jgi:hypothetical protein